MKLIWTKPPRPRQSGKRDPTEYQLGPKNSADELRVPGAVVMRGDSDILRGLVQCSRTKHPVSFAVLSFQEPAEALPTERLRTVMESFERLVLVGLTMKEGYFVWILHREHHRVELHVAIFRELLSTGVTFTPYFGAADRPLCKKWERLINLKFGLHSVQSTTQIRLLRPVPSSDRGVVRRANAALENARAAERISDFGSAKEALRRAGFELQLLPEVRMARLIDNAQRESLVTGPVLRLDFRIETHIAREQQRAKEWKDTCANPGQVWTGFVALLRNREQRQRRRYRLLDPAVQRISVVDFAELRPSPGPLIPPGIGTTNTLKASPGESSGQPTPGG